MGNCIVFSISFAYFSKFLSEHFLSRSYSPCTRLVKYVCVDETCFNHEGVLVLHCLNVFLNMLFVVWKKGNPPERECFSDEEDSDYEEAVILKNQARRKRGANEAASSKRIKPNPKPELRIPKKSVPPTMLNKQAEKKAASGINASARISLWRVSKAIQTESI